MGLALDAVCFETGAEPSEMRMARRRGKMREDDGTRSVEKRQV